MRFTSDSVSARPEPVQDHPARLAFDAYVDAIEEAEIARQAAITARITEKMRAKAVKATIINNMKVKR